MCVCACDVFYHLVYQLLIIIKIAYCIKNDINSSITNTLFVYCGFWGDFQWETQVLDT